VLLSLWRKKEWRRAVALPISDTEHTTSGATPFHDLDLDVGPSFGSLRLDAASAALIELGREIDRANAERTRVAGLLGEVGRSAYALNRLDARALAALSTLAGAAGSSKASMREALAAAIAGDADGGAA
jgi:hypothetical protein